MGAFVAQMMDYIMTIKEEIFDQIEELNTSLRELNDFDLVEL